MGTQTLQRAETAADTGTLWTIDPVRGRPPRSTQQDAFFNKLSRYLHPPIWVGA